jgi:acetyl esterase
LVCSDLRGLPPAFVITAELDPIRDEAEEYTRRLARAGVEASFERIAGARHGIDGATGLMFDALIRRLAVLGH